MKSICLVTIDNVIGNATYDSSNDVITYQVTGTANFYYWDGTSMQASSTSLSVNSAEASGSKDEILARFKTQAQDYAANTLSITLQWSDIQLDPAQR